MGQASVLADQRVILRGPNIAPLPAFPPLPDTLEGQVLLKVGDNITTDHIMPAGAKVLPLRSNIPEISKYVFEAVDPAFAQRAKAAAGGFIVGGDNYGQGSSREHAALAPKYLGVKAVIVRSFARIHLANLINFGIVPLTFKNPADYDALEPGDHIQVVIGNLLGPVILKNVSDGTEAELVHALSPLDAQILKAGGKLPWIKSADRSEGVVPRGSRLRTQGHSGPDAQSRRPCPTSSCCRSPESGPRPRSRPGSGREPCRATGCSGGAAPRGGCSAGARRRCCRC